jgi:formimidoylglutamate deiminase
VLLQGAMAGGSAAAGVALGGLAVGQRADFCVIDDRAPSLAGIPSEHVLDALVFSSPDAAMKRVVVAGRDVSPDMPQQAFAQAMRELW